MGIQHKALLLHTEVRWLFQQQGPFGLQKLAYLADIFSLLKVCRQSAFVFFQHTKTDAMIKRYASGRAV